MSQYKAVIDLIRKEQVSLFLGAGFSLKAGAPSCKLLTERILNDIEEDERQWYANHPLDVLAKEYIDYNDGNRTKLIELLRPLFDFPIVDFSDHQSLAAIPHFRRIFTTNYDCLLEKAYGDSCIVVKRNEDVHNANAARATVFKIHGDFDYPDDLLITKDDYFDFYRSQRNELIWDVVKAEFASHPILFIGYSLEDDNIYTLIKRVKEQSNGATNPIFLIAPGMTSQKRKRLERIGVQYFDAKAEDFFKELFLVLDRYIVKDARRKRITDSTFHKYCKHRGLQIDLKSTPSKNEVGNVKILNEGKHTINFRISNDIAEMVMGPKRLFNDTMFVHGIPIPALKIPAEKLKEFSHTVNGVWLSDQSEISSLLIAPTHNEIQIQIKIPTRNFREKTNILGYNSAPGEATFVLSQDSFTLTMVIEAKTTSNYTINLKVDFKDKYADNSEAIRWLNLLMALWNNEEVVFSNILGGGSFSLANPTTKLQQTDFEERMLYYNNINEIEDLIGKSFSSYEAYSKDNLEKTRIILSYLKKGLYTESIPKNATISFEMIPSDEPHVQELRVGVNKYCFGITKESIGELEFNGESIKIPYQHEFYRDCEVIQRDRLSNGNYSMKIKVSTGYVYKWYSDNPGMDHQEGMETIHLSEEPVKGIQE